EDTHERPLHFEGVTASVGELEPVVADGRVGQQLPGQRRGEEHERREAVDVVLDHRCVDGDDHDDLHLDPALRRHGGRPGAGLWQKARVRTGLPPARWATSLAKPAEAIWLAWLVLLRTKDDTLRSEPLVLARNEGYDDCVRRAAAIEAMAMPPTRPTRST